MSDNRNNNTQDIKNNKESSSAASFNTTIFAVDLTKGLKRFWYIILVLLILFGSIGFAYKKKTYVPMYESTVSFSVTAAPGASANSAVFASYYDNSSTAQLSKSFPYVLNTALMRNAIMNTLGKDYINGTISAQAAATDSNIFNVSVKSNSPDDAFEIVNAVIEVYPEVAQFVFGNIHLKILIKPLYPEAPYTTSEIAKFTTECALIGAVCGFGLIALYAFFRNTVRVKEDIKNKLNQKCLVEVPYVVLHRKTSNKNKKESFIFFNDKHPLFKESFRMLRKRLLKRMDNSNGKILAVTSAIADEGKSTVALNLAYSLSISGKKTAVIDLDIGKRPFQTKDIIIDAHTKKDNTDTDDESDTATQDNFKGITDLIASKSTDFSSICKNIDSNLDLYIAGTERIDLRENSLADLFDYLAARYDYVIVNTSPCKFVSETVNVCNMCDNIVFVVKQDSVSIDKIRKSLEHLSFSNAKLLGFVLNAVQEGFSGYGGYYYGGKYGYGRYGYNRYGYGRYGYGRYGYGRYGYGGYYGRDKGYGYGGYGYGYGYGYGEDDDEYEHNKHKHSKSKKPKDTDISAIDESDIPDNNE